MLEDAISTSHVDAQAGLKLAREALRAADLRCLRVRCAAQIGNVVSLLGNLDRSARILRAAYGVADGCRCCGPILDRNMAKLLSKRGEPREAEILATRAVETSSRAERPVSLLYRAFVRQTNGLPYATTDLCEAIPKLAPGSDHQRVAQFNMLDALAQSRTEANLECVYELLPGLEQSFKGLRDVSMQRGHLSWLTGQVKASLTEFRPADGWILINEASDALSAGCRKFKVLKLPAYHAACWADWAAVQYMKMRNFDRARMSFSDRLSWTPARRDRQTPNPFGIFADSAAPILAGDPSPLLAFREETKRGEPLIPFPELGGKEAESRDERF
jgi:hypothetical protein